ncbi:MAG: flippase-like domain-containing protein [Candidatus Aureabacteria bacterium]|nr:flippase-like domain-containing protein [Candidatus Auribacterota bacterium]
MMLAAWRNRFIIIFKLGFCFVLLFLLYQKLDVKKIFPIVHTANYTLLSFCFLLLFVNSMLSALKWKILLEADGVFLSFFFLLRSYMIGSFMNLFLPSNIGGDVVRVYQVAKESRNAVKSLASVFMDRASGFVALAFIGFMASLRARQLIENQKLICFLFTVFAVILAAFFAILHPSIQKCADGLLQKLSLIKVRELFQRFIQSLQVYKKNPRLMGKIFIIAFLFQGLVIWIVYLYSRALHYETAFHWFVMFIPIISIIESIPLTPFSLGTRDWSYVLFFTLAGLTIEQAEGLALTYLFMTLIYVASTGLFFLFFMKKKEKV